MYRIVQTNLVYFAMPYITPNELYKKYCRRRGLHEIDLPHLAGHVADAAPEDHGIFQVPAR